MFSSTSMAFDCLQVTILKAEKESQATLESLQFYSRPFTPLPASIPTTATTSALHFLRIVDSCPCI